MAGILRGDIRWADLNPVIGSEGGLCPVFILSHNVFNERSGTVIAVAITSPGAKSWLPYYGTRSCQASQKIPGKDQSDSGSFYKANWQKDHKSI